MKYVYTCVHVRTCIYLHVYTVTELLRVGTKTPNCPCLPLVIFPFIRFMYPPCKLTIIVIEVLCVPILILPDPQTKDWLIRNLDPVFGFPGVVRFSWATCAQILEQNAIDFEW